MDLSEIGTSVMQMSQRHLQVVSQNIANILSDVSAHGTDLGLG